MGALMRSMDWTKTVLGPVSGWSQALRTMIGVLLRHPFPLLLLWGSRLAQLYNDAYRPITAAKHPNAMGQPGSECWAEIWHIVGPMFEAPLSGQPATWSDDLLLLIDRRGFLEETHFKVACSAVPDETIASTGVGGVLATVTETTGQVYSERQLKTLRDLGARVAEAKTPEQACETAATVLGGSSSDVPFCLFYLMDEQAESARLVAEHGFGGERGPASPAVIHRAGNAAQGAGWTLTRTVTDRTIEVLTDVRERFGALPTGRWLEPPRLALSLPLASLDQPHPYGVLIVGLNPHRELDDDYRAFFELATAHVVAAVRHARAREDQLRAHEALEASEKRLYELFMQAPAPICVFRGMELVFEMANDLYFRVAGRGEDILGRSLLEAIPEARGQGFDDILRGVMTSGEAFIGKEMPLRIDRRGKGELEDTWWTFIYAPLRNSRGVIDRVMALVHDVTEQVRASKEREGLVTELQRAVRSSEIFVGILGHDLKNPLSAIMTAANLLEVRADSEKIATPVSRIVISADRMDRMISQLLDFASIRLGRGIPIERTGVDLAEVSRSVIEELESAPNRHIQLESVGNVAGTWDRDRLCQLVSNLVSNACQHGTPGGPVLIRLDGTNPDVVCLEVRNRGVVAPEHLPVMFEPLGDSCDHPRRRSGSSGLGLGLYITKQIASAHGGTIDVESNEDEGTRFIVDLPRHSRETEPVFDRREDPIMRGAS
jgi:signal transduction histidine kinase